jgi:hypothetical protein
MSDMAETPPMPMQPTPAAPVAPVAPKRSRRRLVIVLVAALVAAAVVVVGVQLALAAVNAHAVVRYTSTAEHYSVMVPGKPIREKVKLGGLIPINATHWTDGDRYYSVSSSPGGMPPSLQGMFLDGALRGALKNAPGVTASALKSLDDNKVFSAQPEEIKLSGAQAFRITVAIKGAPAPFHMVFAGHGQLLYMVVYSDSPDNRDRDFLDSFKFVG